MDWGLSAVIIGLVAFISNMLTDIKLKKLSNTVAEMQKRLNSEEMDNDGGSGNN